MKLYAEICKVDDEKRMVYGYASTEALDSQKEIVRREAIEDALPDYMKFANVREMHTSSAVGVAKDASMDDKGLYLAAKIVDDSAWAKVKESVYKGFSIGGKALEKLDGVISKLRLSEISLVDRPANPECVFDVFKADDAGLGEDGDDEPLEPFDEDDGKAEANQDTEKREFTAAQRKEAAKKGHAMKDGSFPINTVTDLENAIQAIGRAKDPEAARAHIRRRAKALGAEDKLPESWTKADAPDDLQKYLGGEAWDAMRAINALGDIYNLYSLELAEGDTAQLASLQQVIDGLKAFIASEIQEPMEAVDAGASPVMMADEPGDIEKAGARNSKADMDKIQQIHDHAAALGAGCSSVKAELQDDIQKLEAIAKLDSAGAEIAKLEAEKSDLQKRVAELEAMPMPSKIVAKAVGKAQDNGGSDGIDIDAEVRKIIDSPMPPIEKSAQFLKLQYRIQGRAQ